MIVRNGVRPNKVTELFFHAATVFALVFFAFMIATFVSSERLGQPWSTIGSVSFIGFFACCVIYSVGDLVDRRRAKRKAAN